jgi:hypothetical protein
MAPTISTKRQTQPGKSILKKSGSGGDFTKDDSDNFFKTSKKDKRHIKHAQLLSRISKHEVKPKRRRPNKKLVATLDSLADALPESEDEQATSKVAGERPDQQINVIKRNSLKSKPGALKRRQKLDNEERARFAKNMAQMACISSSNSQTNNSMQSKQSQQPSRWAALRGFISQTLEKRSDMPSVTS